MLAACTRARMYAACLRQARQHLDPRVLQPVGVLKLVNQDVRKALAVMPAQIGMVAQQLVAAQHQLAKVGHALALALLFIQPVQLHLAAAVAVFHRHIGRAQALFLAAVDEPLQLPGGPALLIHVELLAQALDGGKLILHIQHLKRLRQPRRLPVRAQKPVGQPVKRAHPHAPRVQRQHGRQARLHLARGLVGKRHGQHAAGRHLPRLQQPGNARGQHPRLARTGPGQNERVLRRQGDGGALLGIQPLQQRVGRLPARGGKGGGRENGKGGGGFGIRGGRHGREL